METLDSTEVAGSLHWVCFAIVASLCRFEQYRRSDPLASACGLGSGMDLGLSGFDSPRGMST